MKADLHTHSSRSDGLHAPAELVRQASEVGLDWLALTDHDSVAGIAEASGAAAGLGLRLIAGVELSVREASGFDDHMLGLFVDPTAAALLAWLERLQSDRQQMAEHTIGQLERLGVPIGRARVAELAEGAVVTRPHIARALVEAGHVASEQEAFDRWLGSGRPAAPRRPSVEPAIALDAIRGAGGVAVLAHPVFPQDPDAERRLAQLPARLETLAAAGLRGVECHYPDATPELSAALVQLTEARGLIVSGGSDYHGPGKAPNAPLGSCAVDAEIVEQLARSASA